MSKSKPVTTADSPEDLIQKIATTPFVLSEDQPQTEAVEPVRTGFARTVTAADLLRDFLNRNNIDLSVSPVHDNLRSVSDGSVIIALPKIIATYKNG